MQIDPSKVQWDSPTQPAESPSSSPDIDASAVTWDAPESHPSQSASTPPVSTETAPASSIAQRVDADTRQARRTTD